MLQAAVYISLWIVTHSQAFNTLDFMHYGFTEEEDRFNALLRFAAHYMTYILWNM